MNEVTVMIIKTATCLALAAACLSTVPVALAQTGGQTVVVTPPPRGRARRRELDPNRNLKEAQQYNRLLETTALFGRHGFTRNSDR
jgi:hypothetical protein